MVKQLKQRYTYDGKLYKLSELKKYKFFSNLEKDYFEQLSESDKLPIIDIEKIKTRKKEIARSF